MNTIDSWSSIETIIRQRLDLIEIDRRQCAVCGRQGPSLSRCFGCQMVYYCGEDHQAEDWSKEHAQKCAHLEWVALGEFIQALPAQPPLPALGDKWSTSLKEINSWINWFSIRTNIVNLANNTANVLKNLIHLTDKRQPTYQNAVDGLLAAVTDLLSHVLTIGKALIYFGLQPNVRPLVIHILSGFNRNDLVGNDQSPSNLPARFHELLNMFPDNKGVELVIVIGDDDQDNTDHSSIPHAKLKPDRLIITTIGKGRLLDTSDEKRLQRPVADLLVYFNAAHLFLTSNKELLKTMLTRQRPTLLTFEDEEEFNQAKIYLTTKQININQAGSNKFSSLIMRQRSDNPNSIYSTNNYQILLNTIALNVTGERNDDNCSLLSRQYSHQSSIGIQHDHIQQQHNPGLKQVNGRIYIESLSSSSSSPPPPPPHNTQANNNGTLLDTNVHIVSTTNTTVQPLVRSNNNIRQPAIVQRRHHSPPTSPPPPSSSAITTTTYKEARPVTTAMMTTVESTRNGIKPLPKPRLSLVKITNKDAETIISPQVNGSIVQRIKPFFEQPSIISPQEPKFIKQQQRQPVSIPYTYQTGTASRATCLDDVISSKKVNTNLPLPVETHINGRTVTAAAVVYSPTPIETRIEQRVPMTTASQLAKPFIERRTDERTIKTTRNNMSSPLMIPIEIRHDQRTVISATTIASPTPSLFIENRSDERIVTAVPIRISPSSSSSSSQPAIETRIDKPTVIPAPTSNPSPPRPPPPPISNEVIYTEVIKNHERPLSSDHTNIIKSPLSPSRSFIIPTKSPSISSKNSSFNLQRPSRPVTTTNYSFHTNKSRPTQTMMTSDRISLYSQRSTKQQDVGVTIKNLSECIDRVGIVFEGSNRSNETSSAGLTTVDLIREQLAASSSSKPTESLLDKLHKSNSSNRLQTSSSRTSMNNAIPRSKSQQATRTYDEKPSIPKPIPTSPPPATHSIRRSVGVFLPLTAKNTHDSEQTIPITSEQSSTLVYQNFELHTSTPPRTLDYTLKQHSSPICNGIPKPFRKPTAIIEPSPVITSPVNNLPEPNYINLLPPQDEHIYTNANGVLLTGSSNSNSYTSKTSSIYSSSDKQNVSITRGVEPLYAVTTIPLQQQQQQQQQHEQSIEYDSFDDELVVDDIAKIEKALHSNDNTDDDSFDDDENHSPIQSSTPSKNSSTNFFRSTLNRLTRSNKSLERLGLNPEPITNDYIQETNASNIADAKAKKTLRSIKARREAKKTGNLSSTFTGGGDEDTTSIDSNCSTQTATSLNKTSKSSHHRFRLFRRKVEKEFASDTEAEKHQTEQRRKKWNKKIVNESANELKTKRLLMMSDDDEDENNKINLNQQEEDLLNEEPHIYDHIIHDEPYNNPSRMGKLSNETHLKSPTVTLDEIRSEIQAEIAARQDNQLPTTASNLTLQKKRSKSVTFLDELLADDSKQKSTNIIKRNDLQIKPSTTIKRIEKGDARSICGALTGTGPIRGIIKAANNDITGTTAPVSPSAAAAIYLSGATVDTRCTSPKVNERTHRPLSTYTVGSARFYDGAPLPPAPAPPPPPPTHSFNQNNNVSNHRPILNNVSHHSTSDNVHHKRPTAKVSPFQTKSLNDASSSPVSTSKQTSFPSTSKKSIRPPLHKNTQMSHDITNVTTPSTSDGVGGVSKRLQSNF